MKKLLVLIPACFATCLLFAQTLPLDKLPKPARQALEDYVFIPDGTFTMNIRNGFDSLQLLEPKEVEVPSLYMSRYEITVAEYLRFIQETGDRQNNFDTGVWRRDLANSWDEPMTRHYFSPYFKDYPMLGVTWEQAVRYCLWKTEQVNALLENSDYKVEIRLPTNVEWQFAAFGVNPPPNNIELISDRQIFPWPGNFFDGKKDCLQLNCNSGTAKTLQDFYLLSWVSDGGLYTMQVKSFQPNGYGLYQMAGNVAEWTSDNYAVDTTFLEKQCRKYADHPETLAHYVLKFPIDKYNDYKIVKGGSWLDEPFYMQVGVVKIQHPKRGSVSVGFRPVLIISDR